MLLILLLLLSGSFSATLTSVDDENDDGSGAGLERYMLPAAYTIEDTDEQIHFRKEGKPSKGDRMYKLDLSLVL